MLFNPYVEPHSIDLREHIALVYVLWLEDEAVNLMTGMDWAPLAGIG